MKPRWVLHPTLLAAMFVLEVALANKVEPAGFIRALVIAILAGIGLTMFCWAITRDRWLGGLVATPLVLAIISMIPAYSAWTGLRDAMGTTVALGSFGLLVFAVIALPALQLARARKGSALLRGPATSLLNRFASVLIVVVLAFHVAPDLPGTAAAALRARGKVSVAPASQLPNIYIILLDGSASTIRPSSTSCARWASTSPPLATRTTTSPS